MFPGRAILWYWMTSIYWVSMIRFDAETWFEKIINKILFPKFWIHYCLLPIPIVICRYKESYCWHILVSVCCIWLCLSEKGTLYSIVGEMFSLLSWIVTITHFARIYNVLKALLVCFFSPPLKLLWRFYRVSKTINCCKATTEVASARCGCSYPPTLITELSSCIKIFFKCTEHWHTTLTIL